MKNELVKKIEDAFTNVPPGEVGLREAIQFDKYGLTVKSDDRRFSDARVEDQKIKDWRVIPDSVLKEAAVFPHLDDAGFKFALPAVLRWTARIDFDPRQDPSQVAFFLLLAILPQSRSTEKPELIAQRWQLTAEQIRVTIEWIEAYLTITNPTFYDFQREQLTQWKKLIGI